MWIEYAFVLNGSVQLQTAPSLGGYAYDCSGHSTSCNFRLPLHEATPWPVFSFCFELVLLFQLESTSFTGDQVCSLPALIPLYSKFSFLVDGRLITAFQLKTCLVSKVSCVVLSSTVPACHWWRSAANRSQQSVFQVTAVGFNVRCSDLGLGRMRARIGPCLSVGVPSPRVSTGGARPMILGSFAADSLHRQRLVGY